MGLLQKLESTRDKEFKYTAWVQWTRDTQTYMYMYMYIAYEIENK